MERQAHTSVQVRFDVGGLKAALIISRSPSTSSMRDRRVFLDQHRDEPRGDHVGRSQGMSAIQAAIANRCRSLKQRCVRSRWPSKSLVREAALAASGAGLLMPLPRSRLIEVGEVVLPSLARAARAQTKPLEHVQRHQRAGS